MPALVTAPDRLRRWLSYVDETGWELYRDVRSRPVGPEEPGTDEAIPASEPAPNTLEPLAAVRAELGDCTRCGLAAGRTHIVFGEGDPAARLMFVGEGPGAREDATGRPFVGRAGELLDRMIGAMGLRREAVYIANIVKCRPPGNRDPQPAEVATCLPFLERQIAAIEPEVIITLGKPAARALLGLDGPIRGYRGVWHTLDETPVLPTLHPAYLLRNPSAKRDAWSDLQEAMGRLGLSAPAPGR